MRIATNGLGALVLGALGLSVLPRPVEDKVSAREFVILDAEGKTAARLGMGPDDEPVLTFFYPHGSEAHRLELGLESMGAPFVELSDSLASWSAKGVDLRLSVEGEPGEPVVLLSRKERDSAEVVTLRLGIGYDQMPSILLSAPKGQHIVSIGDKK